MNSKFDLPALTEFVLFNVPTVEFRQSGMYVNVSSHQVPLYHPIHTL